MSSETKVPMPYTDCWGYDREQGKKIPVLWSAEGVKCYGDARASERDAFWMAKVAWLAINFDRVSMAFFDGERFFCVEGIPGSFNTLGEVLERATLTNPRAGETA